MKIKTIMCNDNKEFYAANVEARKRLETDTLKLDVVNIEKGPDSLECALDDVVAGPYVMKQILSAVDEGCDAVVIDCAADPVVRAAREAVDIPVITAGESGMHAAMMVADKFSVIAVLPITSHLVAENVMKYGFKDRLASVRVANVPVLDLETDAEAFDKIRSVAQKAIDEDGAEAIILGCTGMMELKDRMQKALGVPVIEPLTMAVKYAEDLVETNLTSSKKAYPRPKQSSIDFFRNL